MRVFDGGAKSRKVYTCTVCKKLDHWGPGWGWYGSYRQLEDQGLQGVEPIVYCCSEECLSQAKHARLVPVDADEIA